MGDATKPFATVSNRAQIREILSSVYDSLMLKGYNPINQLVGYILSEDPTYITNYNTAKNISNNGKHKLCDCFSGVAKIKIMNTECTQKNTQETGNQFGFCIRCRSLFISYAAV